MQKVDTKLSTIEIAKGQRRLCQCVPAPSVASRLDKIGLYLEPAGQDPLLETTARVVVSVYEVDSNCLPTGSPISSDYKYLTEITTRGLYNFSSDCVVSSGYAIVVYVEASSDSFAVSWRFASISDSEPASISTDAGSTWSVLTGIKFYYGTYTFVPNVINQEAQEASVGPAQSLFHIDDTLDDFGEGVLERTSISTVDPTGQTANEGDTVIIEFGNYVVTMVVDQSGSMTWNDHDFLRIDFLKQFIDDFETYLQNTPSSTASYSILKFRSRRIGGSKIFVQTASNLNLVVDGILVLRRDLPSGSSLPCILPSNIDQIPSGFTDLKVVNNSFADFVLDDDLSPGSSYLYGAYVYDGSDNPQYSLASYLAVKAPSTMNFPYSIVGLRSTEVIVKNSDDYDVGKRKIKLTWSDPTGLGPTVSYDTIHIVRRTDRAPEFYTDGDVLTPAAGQSISVLDGTYVLSPGVTLIKSGKKWQLFDFDTATFDPGRTDAGNDYPTIGQKYYYGIFTQNSAGNICLSSNGATTSLIISDFTRIWEQKDPDTGEDDPSLYGFTPALVPAPDFFTAQQGNERIVLRWEAGTPPEVVNYRYARRFTIYFSEEDFPKSDKTPGGATVYDGTVIYDGPANVLGCTTSPLTQGEFIHRNLKNNNTYYYVIVARDCLNEVSSELRVSVAPQQAEDDGIPLKSATEFVFEPKSTTEILLSWHLPIQDGGRAAAYFGDTVRVDATISFLDGNPNTTAASFDFEETGRRVVQLTATGGTISPDTLTAAITEAESRTTGDTLGQEADSQEAQAELEALTQQAADNPFVLDENTAIVFSRSPTTTGTQISATVEVTPYLGDRNIMASATLDMRAILSVKDTAGNPLFKGTTGSIGVSFANPFDLKIYSDPRTNVNVRRWIPRCCTALNIDCQEPLPHFELNTYEGLYVLTGKGFPISIESKWKGESITQGLEAFVRILDPLTGEPTTRVKLPETNAEGVAVLRLTESTDEAVDQNGNPLGTDSTQTVLKSELPPLDVPGSFVIEVTASYQGYSRTKTLNVRYVASLNMDLELGDIEADGIETKELKAFVYLGDPTGKFEDKVPVSDGVLVTWNIHSLIPSKSGLPISPPPFYSLEQHGGNAIQSETSEGIARSIIYGPRSEFTPVKEGACDDVEDELYEISATASYKGMTITGYGLARVLKPPEPPPKKNRIFMRATQRPIISLLSPSSGPDTGGTSVVITGRWFVPGAEVYFGTRQATDVTYIDYEHISCTTPTYLGAKTVYLEVSTPDGLSTTKPQAFTYSGSTDVLAPDQDPGDPTVTFNNVVLFADGEKEAVFEVLARPMDEGPATLRESGQRFVNAVTSSGYGGQVPAIPDGQKVKLTIRPLGGPVVQDDLTVFTNLTSSSGVRAADSVFARIDNGRAVFRIRCNAAIFGSYIINPGKKDNLTTLIGNQLNQAYHEEFYFEESPSVFTLRAEVILDINGSPASFVGGGSNTILDAPPVWLTLIEPLQVGYSRNEGGTGTPEG